MENPRPEEEKIIKDIENLFRIKKENKGSKDVVLRSIKNLFEYKKKKKIIINQQKLIIVGTIIILNIKVMVIKIKYYRLKNILINLDHI